VSIKWDKYGLHDEQCGCLSCECGHRPSAAQRQRAREAWEKAQRAFEALQKKPSRAELAREERRRQHAEIAEKRAADEREWRRRNPPLSQEQIQELEDAKRRMFPALAGGSKR
jgi:hypothetical protein